MYYIRRLNELFPFGSFSTAAANYSTFHFNRAVRPVVASDAISSIWAVIFIHISRFPSAYGSEYEIVVLLRPIYDDGDFTFRCCSGGGDDKTEIEVE